MKGLNNIFEFDKIYLDTRKLDSEIYYEYINYIRLQWALPSSPYLS